MGLPLPGKECAHGATAWHSKHESNGGLGVALWGFSRSRNAFLTGESPVASPDALAGALSASTADQDWTILAEPTIGSGNETEPPHRW